MASTYELVTAATALLDAITEAEEAQDAEAIDAGMLALEAWAEVDVPSKLAAIDGAKRGLLADAERAKAEANLWVERRKRLEARADSVDDLARRLMVARIETTGEDVCALPDGRKAKLRDWGRPSVRITDEDAIPMDYWTYTRKADLRGIAAAMKGGETVPGAALVTESNIKVDIR